MAFVNNVFGSSIPLELDAMDEVALQAIHLERDYRKEVEHIKSLSIQIQNVDRELDQLENERETSRKRQMELPMRIEVIFSNVESVSQSLLNVNEHVANLRKSLELDKIKSNEDMKRFASTLLHYGSLWTSYDAIYERRPLAIKRKSMKTRIKIENMTLAHIKFKCNEIAEKIKKITAIKEKQSTIRIIQLAKNYKERLGIFKQKADLCKMIQKLEDATKEMTKEKEMLFNAPVVSLAVVPSRMEIEPQVTSTPVVAAAPIAKTPQSDPLMFPSFELPKLQLPRMDASPPKSRCYRDLREQLSYETSYRGGYSAGSSADIMESERGIRRVLAAGFSPSVSYSPSHMATSTPLHGLGQQSMEMVNVSTIAMPIEMGSAAMDSEANVYTVESAEDNLNSSIMMNSSEYDHTPMEYQEGGRVSAHQGSLPHKPTHGQTTAEPVSGGSGDGSGGGQAVVDVRGRRASWSKSNFSQGHQDLSLPMDSGIDQEATSQQLMDQGPTERQRNVPGTQHTEPLLRANDRNTPRRQQHNIVQEQQLAQHSQSIDQGMSRSQQYMAQEQEPAQRSQSIDQAMSRSQQYMTQEQELAQRSQSIDQGMSRSQQHMAQEQQFSQNSQSIGQGMSRRQQHMEQEQQLAQHHQSIDQGMSRRQQHMLQEQQPAQRSQSIDQGTPRRQQYMAQEQEPAQHSQSIDQGTPRRQQYMAQEQQFSQNSQSIGQGTPRRQQHNMPQQQEQPMIQDHMYIPNLIGEHFFEEDEPMLTSQQPSLHDADNENGAVDMTNYSASQTNESLYQQSVHQGLKETVPLQQQAMNTESSGHIRPQQQRYADQSEGGPLEDIEMAGTPLPLGKKPLMQGDAIRQSKDVPFEMAQNEDPALPVQETLLPGDANRDNVDPQTQIDEPELEEFTSKPGTSMSQKSTRSIDDVLDAEKRFAVLKNLMKSPEFHYSPMEMRAVQATRKKRSPERSDSTLHPYFINSFMNFGNDQGECIERGGDGDGVAHVRGDREGEIRKGKGDGDAAAASSRSATPARHDGRVARGNVAESAEQGSQNNASVGDGYNTRGRAPDQAPGPRRAPDENAGRYDPGPVPDGTPEGYPWGPAPDGTPEDPYEAYPGDDGRSPYFEGCGPDSDAWLMDPVSQGGGTAVEGDGWKSPTPVASPELAHVGGNPFARLKDASVGVHFNFGANSTQPTQPTFSFGGSDSPAAGAAENRKPPNRSEKFNMNFDKSNTPSIFKLF